MMKKRINYYNVKKHAENQNKRDNVVSVGHFFSSFIIFDMFRKCSSLGIMQS